MLTRIQQERAGPETQKRACLHCAGHQARKYNRVGRARAYPSRPYLENSSLSSLSEEEEDDGGRGMI